VDAFDSIVKGGLPVGSLVLLLGEIGAGHSEFAYTSAAKLAMAMKDKHKSKLYFADYWDPLDIPEKICYISITRSEEAVLREVSISFNEEYYKAFREKLVFKDFSSTYFRHTSVPPTWASSESTLFANPGNNGDILPGIVDFLEENGEKSLVIIDSLSDLLTSSNVAPQDVISLLQGLQRISKRWNGLIYTILSKDVADPRIEKAIQYVVDGVLVFDWYKHSLFSQRQRFMYVAKFMGVLPHLDQARIARFMTDISGKRGLVVANSERIM